MRKGVYAGQRCPGCRWARTWPAAFWVLWSHLLVCASSASSLSPLAPLGCCCLSESPLVPLLSSPPPAGWGGNCLLCGLYSWGMKDPVAWTCRLWGVVPRAWGPHRTRHRGVTSARAASSLTGNVAQILLQRAWWVAWDPRGPIPILELGECIPMGCRFTPYLRHIPLSCLWTQENELSCPQHRPGPVDIRIL